MIEVRYDSDGNMEGFSYHEDDLYEDLDMIPDWVARNSPVRTLEDHGRSNQAGENLQVQA